MIDDRYLEIYKHEKVPFWDLFILIFIYEEKVHFLEELHTADFIGFDRSIALLEQKGWIKKNGPLASNIIMRKFGEDIFKKYVGAKKKNVNAKEVEGWIEAWRAIFPEGKSTAGFRYRGNKQDVLTKMVKFVNQYQYTTEEIFHATRIYVETFEQKGYAYMQQAHYFIEKKGVGSTLSSYCEELEETKSNNKENTYGRSIV